MSVYKPTDSQYFLYDFKIDSVRFHGSTRTTSKREATKIEQQKRAQAQTRLKQAAQSQKEFLTLNVAVDRFWDEFGKYRAAPDTVFKNLERLTDFFGPKMLLTDISANDVARLVAWRRSQKAVRGGKLSENMVSNATVNRSVTKPLQELLSRARDYWGCPIQPIRWGDHLLSEPQEVVREVRESEEGIIAEAIREDYLPLIDFARVSGLRMAECLLKKAEVDLRAGQIRTKGKGGVDVTRPITTAMRKILVEQMANPTEYVFTYRARRARDGHARGERRPITVSGLKTVWKRSGVPDDLRFHDLRHDFGTKLLRKTHNLKLVQKALGHADIKTTTKYAHVLDEEVRQGMELVEAPRAAKKEKSA
jgi:integrase